MMTVMLGSIIAITMPYTYVQGSDNNDIKKLELSTTDKVDTKRLAKVHLFSSDYPTTDGAFDETHNGFRDVFVTKLTGDLSLRETTEELSCRGLPITILGTPGDDIILGTDGDDVIHGFGGNDILRGLGGNDLICGGTGDDELMGGWGNDKMAGGTGNDMMYGEQGGMYCMDIQTLIPYSAEKKMTLYTEGLETIS